MTAVNREATPLRDGRAPVPAAEALDMDALETLRTIADAVGAADIESDAAVLMERLAGGRFYVTCLGQFKRGKSSLLNALVGRAVLPTGIVPITSVPTVLCNGPTLHARVRTAAGWQAIAPETLENYVSEEHNPENALGVKAVEVWVPSDLLAGGLCLVDTPGIGSVFEGNTAATRDFLPHIDAALAVIGVDPPLTGEELDLIENVARQVPSLLVVLNKADRFDDAERAQAAAFAERVLSSRLHRLVTDIFQVSATEQLAEAPERTAPTRDWNRLVGALTKLARDSGRALVDAAQERGVARLATRCLAEICAQSAALSRPIAESEARLAALEDAIGDAAHRALQLGHLFNAEQQQLGHTFAARRTAFLDRAIPGAVAELGAAINALPHRGLSLRTAALAAARDIGRRWVEPWLAEEQRAAESAYREIADHFVTLSNEFLHQVHQRGGEYLDRLPTAIDNETGFRVPSRYYFHQLLPLVYGSPLRIMLDVVRPASRQCEVVQRDARKYLTDLLGMNATLVQNDLDQRVTDSRQRLEAQIQGLLRSVYTAVERALERARAAHTAGEQAVAAALGELAQLRSRVQALAPAPPVPHSSPTQAGTTRFERVPRHL